MSTCKLCEDRTIPYAQHGKIALAIVRIRCDKHRMTRAKADAWVASAMRPRLMLPAPEARCEQ